jgi:hypothetical protein
MRAFAGAGRSTGSLARCVEDALHHLTIISADLKLQCLPGFTARGTPWQKYDKEARRFDPLF